MPNAPEEITRLLTPTEKLLWHGRPRQGIVFRRVDIVFIPISMVVLGIAVYIGSLAIASQGTSFFAVIHGALFILFGIFAVTGRFLVEAWQRACVFYAVTNERIIIVAGVFSQRINSFTLRTINKPVIVEQKNGEGIISFDGSMPFVGVVLRTSWESIWMMSFHQQFILIPEARSVYDLILKAQRDAANG